MAFRKLLAGLLFIYLFFRTFILMTCLPYRSQKGLVFLRCGSFRRPFPKENSSFSSQSDNVFSNRYCSTETNRWVPLKLGSLQGSYMTRVLNAARISNAFSLLRDCKEKRMRNCRCSHEIRKLWYFECTQ